MTRREDLKIGDKVKHNSRSWYQLCEIVEVGQGCNSGVKVFCEDVPIYEANIYTPNPIGFTKGFAEFCLQDITKVG